MPPPESEGSRGPVARRPPGCGIAIAAACLVLAQTLSTFAATDEAEHDGLETMTLEDLLETEVTVSSLTPRPLREAPGVVTVITREEIVESGARSLMDVLSLVPGFDFGVDVQGSVGAAFRGNWGTEGKILVLIDGQEINEPLYRTVQFGGRFPIDHIQRIEVMRGPGSAMYGGAAELAVVNIVTRGPQDLAGGFLSGTLGTTASGLSRGRLSLYGGGESAKGLSASVATVVGQGIASDQTYRDFFGNEYRLRQRQDLTWIDLGVSARGLDVRFILDRYHTTSRDAFGESLAAPVATDFTSYYLDLKYRHRLNGEMVLVPRLAYKHQTPWRVSDPDAGGPTYYDKTAQTVLADLRLTWDPEENINLIVGAEYVFDTARLNRTDTAGLGLQQLFDGHEVSSYHTFVVYSQALLWHRIANLLVGARFEHNSIFKSTFVPRLGVTKVLGRLHLKLLASRAFKAPGHENLGLNPDLRPETTTTFDVEAGYRLFRHWYAQVNVFHIIIEDPIIFTYVGGRETYANFRKTGSGGVETEIRYHSRHGRAALRYSWAMPMPDNDVEAYKVAGHDLVARGLAGHRLTLDGAVYVWRLAIAPSLLLYGPRYGAVAAAAPGVPLDGREKPVVLANLVLTWRNLLARGLDVSAGVYDLFDQRFRFLQPHASGHAPLPALSREWVFNVSYTHAFH